VSLFKGLDSPQRRARKAVQERLREQREALDAGEEALCRGCNKLQNMKRPTLAMIRRAIEDLHEARYQLSVLNSFFKQEESKHASN